MRIIGYIEHPVVKITVFSLNMKFAVKLEAGLLEQTYKFRESEQIRGLDDVKKYIDEDFIGRTLEIFREMTSNIRDSAKRNTTHE